ncbi:MAG: NAD(+)/NADH kinase [Heliobacteriaceae bacterium]|jgi:NAD+ kinase|nr:NAD(+)/NADH kinase [Heliobacteriaceae bacterium]
MLKDFAICYNHKMELSSEIKDILEKSLKNRKRRVDVFDIDNLKPGYDFIFVIGGDGTILKACRFYTKFQTPVFGVNLGRLGFLAQASGDEIETCVEKILEGRYKTESRIMLKSGENTALNDFVVKDNSTGRTSRFSLKINGKAVCDYLADGIIVATPTGSTAYGLSAGGPVLTPGLNAFVIVPICPHTLTARPLVVPDSGKITICTGNEEYVVFADGQECFEFKSEITIEKSEYSAKLALLEDTEFYSILRSKLHWGTSPIETC